MNERARRAEEPFLSRTTGRQRLLFAHRRSRGRLLLGRWLSRLGLLLILAGAGTLTWAATVYVWQDPFTTLLAERSQRALAREYETREASGSWATVEDRPAQPSLAVIARRYQRTVKRGESVGRLSIPKLDQDLYVVWGTDTDSLKKGPGIDPRTAMPGRGELVYIAGHRTTYGAPFSDIDRLKPGDPIRLRVPYATFRYRVSGRRIVPATYLQALKSRGREEIALQACWPRFFASQRIIVYAKPVATAAPRRPLPDEHLSGTAMSNG